MSVRFEFKETVDSYLRKVLIEELERNAKKYGAVEVSGSGIDISDEAHRAGVTEQIISQSGCDFMLQPAKDGLLAEYHVY